MIPEAVAVWQVQSMIPQREITELLRTRLREFMPPEKLEELIAEVKELDGEWEELEVAHRDFGYSVSETCPDICWLAEQVDRGSVLRLYRKKKPVRP